MEWFAESASKYCYSNISLLYRSDRLIVSEARHSRPRITAASSEHDLVHQGLLGTFPTDVSSDLDPKTVCRILLVAITLAMRAGEWLCCSIDLQRDDFRLRVPPANGDSSC